MFARLVIKIIKNECFGGEKQPVAGRTVCSYVKNAFKGPADNYHNEDCVWRPVISLEESSQGRALPSNLCSTQSSVVRNMDIRIFFNDLHVFGRGYCQVKLRPRGHEEFIGYRNCWLTIDNLVSYTTRMSRANGSDTKGEGEQDLFMRKSIGHIRSEKWGV